MDEQKLLRGSCSCGRNQYSISLPPNPSEILRLLYDDRAEHSRALSLRVPLTHIHSTTYAFFPDETPTTIRRTFTPEHEPYTKRNFCGVCGTQLSYWSEETPEEAELVYINLGSLRNESLERLEDSGLLSSIQNESKAQDQDETDKPNELASSPQGREMRGNPWFEEIIEGSELGRIKRRRGGNTSGDGKSMVEWEITEFESGDAYETTGGTGKRKLGSYVEGDDIHMRGD